MRLTRKSGIAAVAVFFALGMVQLLAPGSAHAQKVDASVLNRQVSDSDYAAVVPGYTKPIECTETTPEVDCAVVEPAAGESAGGALAAAYNVAAFNVTGTTLSLLLPDGRVALVNCVSRYSTKGNYLNRRTCGMPLVPSLQVEFKGQQARLEWLIGADKKKTESETYRVVAMLAKRPVVSDQGSGVRGHGSGVRD